MSESKSIWLVPVLGLVIILAALWYFRPVREQPATPAPQALPAAQDETETPHYPLPDADEDTEARNLVPLPPLDDSDAYFRLALIDLFGSAVDPLLAESTLIEKSVATLDNLPRERLAEKLRPVGRVAGAFLVDPGDDDEVFVLSPANYRRYDALVGLFEKADPAAIVDTYRRFYPLLQQAYVSLGYPDGHFNDRVIEVIDLLLATPDPGEPVLLVRPHVLYEFADARLEALSAGQKILLRMGPGNAARVKSRLGELRARLVRQPG
jgi:Protein of unknown function (DUF3014)